MELIKAAIIGAVFTLLFSISASAQELTSTPKQSSAPKSWEIEITSTGGFTGSGNGGIAIQSNGRATVRDLTKVCNLQIPSDTFQELERRFTDWNSSYRISTITELKKSDPQPAIVVGTGCCDLITYSLRIKFSGSDLVERQYSESWVQYLDSAAPESLKMVRRISLQLKDSLSMNCK